MPGSSNNSTDSERSGKVAAAISNGVVKLLRDYTGRGPTKTRTYINGDYLAVVMYDTLTKGERSLVEDGRSELVLAARKAYQQTMRDDLIGLVERLSERKVIAFLSDNHLDPDIAVESFILEQIGADGDRDGDGGVDRLVSADATD
jgi:uncharacterized protein YbcI